MRKSLPYLLFGALILGYVLLELMGPQPQDWRESYSREDKLAFGNMALYKLLPDLFPDQEIKEVVASPVRFLDPPPVKEPANYILITDKLKLDQHEVHALLDFARGGNSVFIAASEFNGRLNDSLDLMISEPSEYAYEDDYKLSLVAPYDPDKVQYDLLKRVYFPHFISFGGIGNSAFDVDASTRKIRDGWELLGINQRDKATFLRFELGEGYLYLHSVPMIFSNYFLVQPEQHEYVSKALSFLPLQPVLWDEYYKPGRLRTETPFKYLLQTEALRWAWITAIVTLLLFMTFQSKRKQRPIPVLQPVTNTTLDFTQTVAALYRRKADHADLARKKIQFLMEHIRQRFRLPTNQPDQEFMKRLALRSGRPLAEIESLFHLIQEYQGRTGLTEAELAQLAGAIDDFYDKSK